MRGRDKTAVESYGYAYASLSVEVVSDTIQGMPRWTDGSGLCLQ